MSHNISLSLSHFMYKTIFVSENALILDRGKRMWGMCFGCSITQTSKNKVDSFLKTIFLGREILGKKNIFIMLTNLNIDLYFVTRSLKKTWTIMG